MIIIIVSFHIIFIETEKEERKTVYNKYNCTQSWSVRNDVMRAYLFGRMTDVHNTIQYNNMIYNNYCQSRFYDLLSFIEKIIFRIHRL